MFPAKFLGVLLSLASIVLAVPAQAQSAFYSASAEDLQGEPGTLIRSEPMLDAPVGTLAYRILYRSRGLQNQSIAVSGRVMFPDDELTTRTRPIVAWAHPTSGVVPKCAPSLSGSKYSSIPGLEAMIKQGFGVVSTDYPGLGTEGPHPYLIGVSEGRAVLDSVRAAAEVERLLPGKRFVVWGHSQGGQASLFTGLLAETYAPDLELVGVAAAAPATELATLFADDLDTSGGNNLTAMTLWSWKRVFGLSLDKAVTAQSEPVIDELAGVCLESVVDVVERLVEGRPLAKSFLLVDDLAQVEPWSSLMKENTPGVLQRSIPVFISQGTDDKIVRPSVTRNYANSLCRNGSAVEAVFVDGAGHGFIARDTAAAAVRWMADRFAGRTPPSTCGQF